MPYLTPEDFGEGEDCRPLSIPATTDWLAIVSGALTELTKPYNWEQWGSLTVDECVERMQEMIDLYYEGCNPCMIGGEFRVIRINFETGELEELNGDGEWVPATGDYDIPPPEAREGGTPDDQICLAAKNAVNVLDQLYESLSESWGSTLSEAEALTDFTLILVGVVGFAFAPITAAIAAFFGAVFTLLYNALEYLGADLWDEDFTDQITCFLVECATNDAGVVTFDWDCFTGKLNSLADDFLLSETQLRLYLQITYILYFIGGVDGLNLAGATTEIEDDDCPCGCEINIYESCGYGTVENIGGTRWRVSSGPTGGGNHSVCVQRLEASGCWGYTNYSHTGGAITYSDGTGCTGSFTSMTSACDGSNTPGYPDDLVGWFIQSNSAPFVIEMDVICKDDCP